MSLLQKILFSCFAVLLFIQVLIGFPKSLTGPKFSKKLSDLIPTFNGAEQKMAGVHLVETRGEGQRDWELKSESAEGSQGAGTWALQKVNIQYYDKEKLDYVVVGDIGKIDTGSKNMEIIGNVVTHSKHGYKYMSSNVFYNSETRILKSPGAVKLTTPDDSQGGGIALTGKNLQAEVGSSRVIIHEDIQGKKPLKDGRIVDIKSKSVEIDGATRLARFIGNVEMKLGDMAIEGPEVDFNYADGTELLKSLIVKGGARLVQSDKFATADNMVFDPEKNELVLTGKPRVVQDADELIGDKIIFIQGGKKVKVENIKAKLDQTK